MHAKNLQKTDIGGPLGKLYRQNLRKVNEMRLIHNIPSFEHINTTLIKKLFTGGEKPYDDLYQRIKADIELEEDGQSPSGVNHSLLSSKHFKYNI